MMDNQRDELALDILRIFIDAIKRKDENERRELAAEIHQTIVIIDDRLCDQFDFSRRARGKYLLTK